MRRQGVSIHARPTHRENNAPNNLAHVRNVPVGVRVRVHARVAREDVDDLARALEANACAGGRALGVVEPGGELVSGHVYERVELANDVGTWLGHDGGCNRRARWCARREVRGTNRRALSRMAPANFLGSMTQEDVKSGRGWEEEIEER